MFLQWCCSVRPEWLGDSPSRPLGLRLVGNGFDSPSVRVMMFKVLPPGDPTKKHRLGDPPLFRANRKIHVRDHEPNQGYACQSMRYVYEPPGCVAQKIRIPCE